MKSEHSKSEKKWNALLNWIFPFYACEMLEKGQRILVQNVEKGKVKGMYIKNIIDNFKKYSFLLRQLVSRDFKVKYKRSVLGVLWSLLYPSGGLVGI